MSQVDLKFLKKNGAATWALLVQNGVNWIGATNIFWNNGTGRLGIGSGTSAPGNTLEVNNGTVGQSGIRMTQMTNATAPTAGAAFVGVNATGDLVVCQGPQLLVDVDRTTTYTINTTDTTILYATVTKNVGTCYNTSTGVFTPPANALYKFSVNNNYTVNNSAQIITKLYVSGTKMAQAAFGGGSGLLGGAATGSNNISIDLDLTTSQTVTIAAIRSGTVSPLFAAGEHSLTITRLT